MAAACEPLRLKKLNLGEVTIENNSVCCVFRTDKLSLGWGGHMESPGTLLPLPAPCDFLGTRP